MINGVANEIVVDAVEVVAQEAVPAAVGLAVLEGRDHHLEPVSIGAPGVGDILQRQKVGLCLDGSDAQGSIFTGYACLQNIPE